MNRKERNSVLKHRVALGTGLAGALLLGSRASSLGAGIGARVGSNLALKNIDKALKSNTVVDASKLTALAAAPAALGATVGLGAGLIGGGKLGHYVGKKSVSFIQGDHIKEASQKLPVNKFLTYLNKKI